MALLYHGMDGVTYTITDMTQHPKDTSGYTGLGYYPNFTYQEFNPNNYLNTSGNWELYEAIVHAAQEIRNYFGSPLNITSGYRNDGADYVHNHGMAIDFYVSGHSFFEVYDAVYNYSIGWERIEAIRGSGLCFSGTNWSNGHIHTDVFAYLGNTNTNPYGVGVPWYAAGTQGGSTINYQESGGNPNTQYQDVRNWMTSHNCT